MRDGGKKALKKSTRICKRIIKQGKSVNKNVIYDSRKQGLSYLIMAQEIARPTLAFSSLARSFFIICNLFWCISGNVVTNVMQP